MKQASLLERLNQDGFVIVPSILTAEALASLREAAAETTALARSGHWPYIRTLPKQFPPWPINSPEIASKEGIWGVQSLMHPDLPRHADFIKLYFSDAIIKPTKELLQCETALEDDEDGELVMELFNLLVRPDQDFELRWHRDDIPSTATVEEELTRLRQPAFSAQWNLALYDDESLIVVPGSHLRARTDIERAAAPFAKHIPDQIKVKLNAGDVVFYNNNILHRGVYDASTERMTLHGSAGHVDGSTLRARNVLQHGLKGWVEAINFGDLDDVTRRRAEGMRQRLVKMGHDVGGDVGYSLTDD